MVSSVQLIIVILTALWGGFCEALEATHVGTYQSLSSSFIYICVRQQMFVLFHVLFERGYEVNFKICRALPGAD